MASYKGRSLSGDKTSYMHSQGNAIKLYDKTETITALLALTDTVDLIRLPGGMQLTELETWNPDLCTSGTLAVKIGFRKVNSAGQLTDDDDYFGSSLTNFQAIVTSGTRTRYTFEPITFNEDVFVTLTVTTAASGTAITTGTISTVANGIARGIK
jgi:hypothetical protein